MHFAIEDYTARLGRLDTEGIDFGAFAASPLPEPALRCIRYMHDVEFHTVCYLRDLLLTPAHRDPEITTFLTMWNYEEHWHGEALRQVLEAHGEEAGAARVGRFRRDLGWRDRLSATTTVLSAAMVGEPFVALHMTWGMVQESVTQAGYGRLSARAGHPVLSDLLARIMRQEGRHLDFYAAQATRRLEASARARRLTRFALRRFWSPVGASLMPEPEVRHLVSYLFGGDDGAAAAARLDRRIHRLPGLANLHVATRYLTTHT